MPSKFLTIVFRHPTNDTEKAKVNEALDLLSDFITGRSLEDEMTILDLIENHPDFPEEIAKEARLKTTWLHAMNPPVPANKRG